MENKIRDRGQMVLNINKDRRACRLVFFLLFLLVMVSLNFDMLDHLQGMIFKHFREDQEESGTNFQGSQKVRELLDKLRETARVAADGHHIEYRLTAAEREAWYMRNPCESRSELPAMYAARKTVRDISPNPMWDRVLDEYSNLHRICMKRVGNITHHFVHKSNVTVPGCKFLIADGKFGLGNKFLVTVSALLYAIVSQRVILVPSDMTFSSILCEPFVGSSWLLKDPNFPKPHAGPRNNSWDVSSVFPRKLNDRLQSGIHSNSTSPPLVDAIVVAEIWQWMPWMPPKWFYCNTEQRFLSEVPWMYLSGCIYTIPELFGSPAFGSTLQTLFPDRVVITRLLRSSFLPSDSVWSRFKHLNYVYFQHANRRVGIQLRLFDSHYNSSSSTLMNDRVLDCVLNNDILPQVNRSSPGDFIIRPPPSAPISTVYIASLYSDLQQVMSEFYLHPTVTGEAVRVVQVTSRHQESLGTEEDRQAFVEMLLLSVSDTLLVSPTSTFGGMGQAYGALTPWFIRATEGDGTSCERGQTTDPCQHRDSILGYECPNDPSFSPPESIGLLAECLKIDLGKRIEHGLQIVDNRLSLDAQELI